MKCNLGKIESLYSLCLDAIGQLMEESNKYKKRVEIKIHEDL